MRSLMLRQLVGFSFIVSLGAQVFGCGSTAEIESSATRGTGGGQDGTGGAGGAGGAGGGVCVPDQEVCDGIDNNCDGSVDDGCACMNGNKQPCYSGPADSKDVGLCKAGEQTCVNGSWGGECDGEILPTTDICDDLDNDCNGVIDDGDPNVGKVCDTGLLGVCGAGANGCVAGSIVCQQKGSASAEMCDSLDNNCNGMTDEGNPGGGLGCMTGKPGICAPGVTSCAGGAVVCTQNEAATAENCDGLDNNCDGGVDEGNPGGGAACTTGKLGVCAAGLSACVGGAIVCTQSTPASGETCDGLDNNCDGSVDELNPGGGVICMTGQLGVCAPGISACVGGAIVCSQNTPASAEVCDNLDNNCNGATDDGNPGGGIVCSTGLPGVCGPGLSACMGGGIVCSQSVQASAESCDGLDNNCNGTADEGNPGGGAVCSTGLPGICASGTIMCSGGALLCVQNTQPVAEVCGDVIDNDCNGVVDDGNCGCNSKVLLLGDSVAAANQAIENAMVAAGLLVTKVNGGVSTYAGVPAANTFGAVVILAGDEYDNDMPLAGQSAIVNAWNGGTTGAVFTEWSAYKVTVGKWTVLGQLLVLDRSGQLAANGIQTYTQVLAHPVWNGLPASFSTIDVIAPGAHNVGQIINGGVAVATITSASCVGCPTGGAVVKSGASRTVQIAHSASWNGGGAWVNDANLVKMMTNSASWATKCAN